ncbi:polynucleotide 5'-kinase and 3'-phosphatase [Citrobacter phage CkP1]|nr:polynucleotide 5'-kinase and 3'-phosphatase [Citrobacter phage CkP1]
MKKIILTVGAPGSGKSTWANEFVSKNPGWYILSRDDFREKLFGLDARNNYKYSKQREKAVTSAQIASAESLLELEHTKGVIVADTNLNPVTVNKWELQFVNKHEIELKKFHVPWTELIKRNQYRGDKAVPIDVLRHFYQLMEVKNIYVPDSSLPKAVIFDLDGTLADNSHRSPYDLTLCGKDSPKEMVIMLLKMLREKGYKILTVSGRESGTKEDETIYRRITQKWVLDHVGETHGHYQRKQGDSRKDDIVKEEIFWKHIAGNYNVKLAVDDRAQVVEMWRRIGVECWQVAHGDF